MLVTKRSAPFLKPKLKNDCTVVHTTIEKADSEANPKASQAGSIMKFIHFSVNAA